MLFCTWCVAHRLIQSELISLSLYPSVSVEINHKCLHRSLPFPIRPAPLRKSFLDTIQFFSIETRLLMVGGICSGRGTGMTLSFGDSFWSWWEGSSDLVSDADGEATLGENWSLVEVLARSIRSMMELSLSRASSSFRTGGGGGGRDTRATWRGRNTRATCRRRFGRAIWETGELLCNTITDVV